VTTPYIITVEFHLRPGALADFLPLIVANAQASLRHEPGCQRFDVLVPDGSSDQVLLYEIYDDEPAFQAHCRSPHFHAFDTASRDMCVAKTVQRHALASPTPG
jgi:quinol monooxygenase YgiN